MKQDWSTKKQDMYIAKEVISQYGGDEGLLGIFEVLTDSKGNVSEVRLAEWVKVLVNHYRTIYGEEKGDFVMKKVVSSCLINGKTIH